MPDKLKREKAYVVTSKVISMIRNMQRKPDAAASEIRRILMEAKAAAKLSNGPSQ